MGESAGTASLSVYGTLNNRYEPISQIRKLCTADYIVTVGRTGLARNPHAFAFRRRIAWLYTPSARLCQSLELWLAFARHPTLGLSPLGEQHAASGRLHSF